MMQGDVAVKPFFLKEAGLVSPSEPGNSYFKKSQRLQGSWGFSMFRID